MDLAPLTAWMQAQDGGCEPCVNPRRLDAGTQNQMIAFERAGRRYVLRRPPVDSIYPAARLVEREVRVLRALDGSAVPHPLVFGCSVDAAPGTAFYVMAAVDGFTPTEGLPDPVRSDAALQRQLGLSCVEALVALSRVDYSALGLAGLGRPEGFLQRQVARWREQLASYSRFAGWRQEGPFLQIEAVAGWLAANLPTDRAPALLHGDFHLGNILFRQDDATLAAVVDWELTTIGDPRVDLGWLLATWPERDGADNGAGVAVPGAWALPSPRELVAHYEVLSGDTLGDVTWYVVLACYKLAIIQEGSWARALAGKADPVIGKLQHERACSLLGRARALIGAGLNDPAGQG